MITDKIVERILELQTACVFLQTAIAENKKIGYLGTEINIMVNVLKWESKFESIKKELAEMLENINVEDSEIFKNKELMQGKFKVTYEKQRDIAEKYIGIRKTIEEVMK